jgi:hypothetical protein
MTETITKGAPLAKYADVAPQAEYTPTFSEKGSSISFRKLNHPPILKYCLIFISFMDTAGTQT